MAVYAQHKSVVPAHDVMNAQVGQNTQSSQIQLLQMQIFQFV